MTRAEMQERTAFVSKLYADGLLTMDEYRSELQAVWALYAEAAGSDD